MTHTPEKWYVGYDQEYDIDAGDDGRSIGYPTGRDEFSGTVFMVTGEDKVEIIAEHIRDEKTAHQIKAIPDMLRALESVLSLIDESSGVAGYHLNGEVATWEELGIREEVEAAIKKARGVNEEQKKEDVTASDTKPEATVECFLGCPATNDLMKKYMRKQYGRTR